MNSNRISLLGSLTAAFAFFFFPLLEVKPNRLASGLPINLFELQGDYRYFLLFLLALIPIVVALQTENQTRRGWTLAAIGNLMLVLTLMLPATAATNLLAGASGFFEEGTRISNPRVLPSAAIALGLLGSYIVLFGGLLDLRAAKVEPTQRILMGGAGVAVIVLMLLSGTFDIYSIMVEFGQRGDTLGQRFIEHIVFVLVSLVAGLIIGIALGLWAARDERMGEVILYSVGIIQTVPSLALFGVLLVPLAILGNQQFTSVFQFFLITLVIGGGLFGVVMRIQGNLPHNIQVAAILITFVVLLVPIGLFAVMAITFGFEAVLNVFLSAELRTPLSWVMIGYLLIPVLMWADRQLDQVHVIRWLRYARYASGALATLGLLYLLYRGGAMVIGGETLAELTIRDLGVSGIGTAPAVIALTLYSLLPLVRNTYAGLNNVDPAVIDSGRGMGMTPAQVFFQIELPLAFPVIMAGVRNAGISLVGIGAVASIIGAGALGDFILLGVNSTSVDLILLGAIPAIGLAVLLDSFLQLLERLFTSPGIRQ